MIRRFLRNYALRHQHPANVALHGVALPVTFVLPIPLAVHGQPLWAAVSFVVGYAMQFVGHAIEGNDAGEVILVKKMLGKPYIDIVDPPNRSSHES